MRRAEKEAQDEEAHPRQGGQEPGAQADESGNGGQKLAGEVEEGEDKQEENKTEEEKKEAEQEKKSEAEEEEDLQWWLF